MPVCEHCGKTCAKITVNQNGRSQLRLCPMCQAERDLRQNPELRPADLVGSNPRPWWKRLWNRLTGRGSEPFG